MRSEFTNEVIRFIKAIPRGKVATYGQIAALAGKPHGARGVSWILHSCSTAERLPWHRVLGSGGKISFPKRASNYKLQIKKLKREGVRFRDTDKLDLKKFQWSKRARPPRVSARKPSMFS